MVLLDKTAQNQPVQDMPDQQAAPVDPQMQERVDMFMANGMNIIHNKKVSDGFIRQIKGAEDTISAIADATLRVIVRIEESANQKGASLELPYLAQVANALMGQIIQIVEAAGVPPLSEEDKYAAYSLAVSKYLDQAVKSGKITPERLQLMGAEAEQTPQGQEITQMANKAGAMPGGNAPVAPNNIPGMPNTGV